MVKRGLITIKCPQGWFTQYGIPLITFILGLISSYLFTLHGYNLSFPDYPSLSIDYSAKNHVNVGGFYKQDQSKNSSIYNPYVFNITFRLTNKGRQNTDRVLVMLWGDNISYSSKSLKNINGKNGFVDVTLPLILKCENNSSGCDFEDIPLGRKVVNLYVYCYECIVSVNNYQLEFCIYDGINITNENCVEQLRYFQ